MQTISTVQWLDFLKSCADQADDIARHYFQTSRFKIQQKSNNTPVTQADLECESKIREMAQQFYPGLPIMGEEHGQCPPDAPLKLIIDPIDGTQNFIRGLPFFASLLAIEENGKIVAGTVSAPATKERWWASAGEGCFYNGTKIHVSDLSDISASVAFHSSIYGSEAKGACPGFLPVLQATKRQRGVGDYYCHMLVAMGCGEFAVDFNLNVWDMAPMKVIIEEAGGRMTNAYGEDTIYTPSIVTSNGKFHDQIVKILNQV